MNKKISATAINALIEALTNIYWYKSELRSFLMNTVSDSSLLSRLNWDDYKRNIVTKLITFLVDNQNTYQNDLLLLISEVSKVDNFSHLERLEDGKNKAKKARESIKALKTYSSVHDDIEKEQEKIEKRRQSAYEKQLQIKGVKDKLEELREEMNKLVSTSDVQARGYSLEKIIKELFTLFDLDPKASFRILGEQVDGAFTFDKSDFLFEGKWQSKLVSTADLDAFSGKLTRKLDNTLGLFLSINGFSEDAVKAHSTGRRLMILMDGSDLMAVLEGRIDLLQLLFRKRRHASQTGSIYLKLHQII